jgi:hypothetical protein
MAHQMAKDALSGSKSVAPAMVSGAMPGDFGDLPPDYHFRPANMIGPLLSGGFSR